MARPRSSVCSFEGFLILHSDSISQPGSLEATDRAPRSMQWLAWLWHAARIPSVAGPRHACMPGVMPPGSNFFFSQTGYPKDQKSKFINMAKDCWLYADSNSHPLVPQSSASASGSASPNSFYATIKPQLQVKALQSVVYWRNKG